MTEDLRALHTAIVAFSEKYPNEVPAVLENALVSAYRNGLIAAARACQDVMHRYQANGSNVSAGNPQFFESHAAAHAAFECAELILDKVLTIETVLQPVP